MTYRHLTQDERYQIGALSRVGFSEADIARTLERHSSTIARELRRNRSGPIYRASAAQSLAQRRRHDASARSRLPSEVLAYLEHGLVQQWSPMQIRGRAA